MERQKGAESNGKADKVPLWQKLYTKDAYMELARTVSYTGISIEDIREKIKPLEQRFGRELMVKAADDLVQVNDTWVRLKTEARHLCWQLLGPPPEHPDYVKKEAPAEPPPKPNKKPRNKKKEFVAPNTPNVNKQATPLMQQWKEAKERHKDMLLLFRVGDFYELFDSDARSGARILGLTLTSRDKTIDMAGFPHHQLETYLHKLLKEGVRVAVCDQVDSANGKAVKREVTRVETPGSMIEKVGDDALYAREYELRQILDRDKTKEQMDEAMALKAEIRRRAKAS
jgi:hypothetical protein